MFLSTSISAYCVMSSMPMVLTPSENQSRPEVLIQGQLKSLKGSMNVQNVCVSTCDFEDTVTEQNYHQILKESMTTSHKGENHWPKETQN